MTITRGSTQSNMKPFPDPEKWPLGKIYVAPNQYGYIWNDKDERWEAVNGPHSGHVYIGNEPPEDNQAMLKDICEGEFWYDLTRRIMMCYINGEWVPIGNCEEYLGVWRYRASYNVKWYDRTKPELSRGDVWFYRDEIEAGWPKIEKFILDGCAVILNEDNSHPTVEKTQPYYTGALKAGMTITLSVYERPLKDNVLVNRTNYGTYRIKNDVDAATGLVMVECIDYLGDMPFSEGDPWKCDVIAHQEYDIQDLHELSKDLDERVYHNTVHVGDVPPSCPEVGQLWMCTRESVGGGDMLKICVRTSYDTVGDPLWIDTSCAIIEEDRFVKREGDTMCGPLKLSLSDDYTNNGSLNVRYFEALGYETLEDRENGRGKTCQFNISQSDIGTNGGVHYNPVMVNKRQWPADKKGKIWRSEIVNRGYITNTELKGWAYTCRHTDDVDYSNEEWVNVVRQVIKPGEFYWHAYDQNKFIFHPLPLADYENDPRSQWTHLCIPPVLQDVESKVNKNPNTVGQKRNELPSRTEPNYDPSQYDEIYFENRSFMRAVLEDKGTLKQLMPIQEIKVIEPKEGDKFMLWYIKHNWETIYGHDYHGWVDEQNYRFYIPGLMD